MVDRNPDQESFCSAVASATCGPCAQREVPEELWRQYSEQGTTPYYLGQAIKDARYAVLDVDEHEDSEGKIQAILGEVENLNSNKVKLYEDEDRYGLNQDEDRLARLATSPNSSSELPPIVRCVLSCLVQTAFGQCGYPVTDSTE